jgi:calmodulin
MFNMFLPSTSCQSCNCNCNCYHSRRPAEKAQQESVLTERSEVTKTSRRKNQDSDTEELRCEDVNIVLRNIGQLDFGQENSMVCKSNIGNDSVARIFDVDEPSLQEVCQAFSVFDRNNDGYFDASDLERVLRSLGLGDGVGVDECEQMIAKYDTNKDGRIDVAEFTKVLEAGFC